MALFTVYEITSEAYCTLTQCQDTKIVGNVDGNYIWWYGEKLSFKKVYGLKFDNT